MAWKGNQNNQVPNIGNSKSDLSQAIAQESSNLSEKKIEINRAYQTRRDTDTQKDNTVKLIDIDTTIMNQLEKLQLTVVDEGNKIKVPSYYASPEKWKSIQKDGVIRDYNGKLILPAVVLQRTTSEKDQTMMMFNRYLTYPVIKQNSEKNRYTKFNLLMGKNVPVNEVYDVTMPDHMVFTYHFIIWTEYIEQMNTIVERINFETEDYWGEARGLRFRTKIDSFSHTVELQVDQDRMVKTEFDLIVNGYLLPDTNYSLEGGKSTTRKWITPKKVVMGVETVESNFDMKSLDSNSEKWRSQKYPNIQKDVVIPPPPVSFVDGGAVSPLVSQILESLNIATKTTSTIGQIGMDGSGSPYLQVVTPPINMDDFGQPGFVSYDDRYFYIYSNGWKRVAISEFS